MPNFERFAQVTIGSRGAKGFLFESPLRITFDVTKSNEPTPNSGTVTLFNLSASSRDQIRTIGDAIELNAGYLRDEYAGRLVVSADVLNIVTEKQGPDIITIVRLGDGAEYLKTLKGSYSFKEGASVKDIITKIASASGITLKSLDGVVEIGRASWREGV